jgi:hypothetical protein
MGPTALLPLLRKLCCGFLSLSAGFEPANLGFNGKHDNYYTTENDLQFLNVGLFSTTETKKVVIKIVGHTGNI